MDISKEIRTLENEIKRIKLLHSLGKIPLAESKKEIRILDARLKTLMNSLPEKEKNLILFRKEHYSVDY